MDDRTLSWYDAQGASTAARYEAVPSPLQGRLRSLLPSGCRVLDIGCGSGRDLAFLLSEGFDAWGLEPSATMRAQALAIHPELLGRVLAGGLPDTGLSAEKTFEVVMCMASFMHIPAGQISDAASALCQLLNAGGRLLISIPSRREGLDTDSRESGGRLFTPLTVEQLHSLFHTFGLRLTQTIHSEDGLSRQGVAWVTLLFEKSITENV